MLTDFLSLVFPKVCYSCGRSLYKREEGICLHCWYFLPKTNFHFQADNPVAKLFWGRVPVVAAAALYRFVKEGHVQELIHHFKYRGKTEIGITLGKYYGNELKQSALFAGVDVIVPVPLHAAKQKSRGFNQSQVFASGLAAGLGVNMRADLLNRIVSTQTQTRKARFDRWRNVEFVFQTEKMNDIKNKHVLLVDDVVTTGATIEACAQKIVQLENTRVSVATLAYAERAF